MTRPVPVSPEAIAGAAAVLRGGGLVAFPTETVYGLGADATNAAAVARVFEVKGRPSFNPLIVHVADPEMARSLARWDERADRVAEAFWPGPLTIVLPRAADCAVVPLVSAGLDTIALRVPACGPALALIEAAGVPVAAPSANPSGTVSPTRAEHVVAGLGDAVDLVIDGGPCAIGLESTVLDLTGERPAILRPGAISAEAIADLVGALAEAAADPSAPTAPGQLASHYAPSRPVRPCVLPKEVPPGWALLGFGWAPEATLNLSADGDLREAAANLFAMLRALDDPRYKGIAVMPVPDRGLGIPINDRLRRAAAPRS